MFRCDSLAGNSFSPKFILALSAAMPVLFGGCVALNIPSIRYHDPEDRGGLLGPHKPAGQVSTEATFEQQGELTSHQGSCLDCGDEELDSAAPETPPEVPWPRFHPLPTRPVFSTVQQ